MRAVLNTKAAPKGSAKTFFSNMYPENGEQPFPDSLMADEAANLIIAGSDTTAMCLVYLIYSVLCHPEVRAKLISEVESLTDSPGWEELESKQCLNHVIEEALRLHVPVPSSLPRTTPKRGAILGGFKIPGGTTCCTQAYTMNRDPTIFPEPDRCVDCQHT